jgi:hypothetical protein
MATQTKHRIEEAIRTTGLPDPSLLEIVHSECRRRTATALRTWVGGPNPETRQDFLRSVQALEVAQRALRHRERESWQTEQPAIFPGEAA